MIYMTRKRSVDQLSKMFILRYEMSFSNKLGQFEGEQFIILLIPSFFKTNNFLALS